jgi:hypothetical protein
MKPLALPLPALPRDTVVRLEPQPVLALSMDAPRLFGTISFAVDHPDTGIKPDWLH